VKRIKFEICHELFRGIRFWQRRILRWRSSGIFRVEDRDGRFLRKVGTYLPNYMLSHTRRPYTIFARKTGYICLYLVIHRTSSSREMASCCVVSPWELQRGDYSFMGRLSSRCEAKGEGNCTTPSRCMRSVPLESRMSTNDVHKFGHLISSNQATYATSKHLDIKL
jgi:hypothetical protein